MSTIETEYKLMKTTETGTVEVTYTTLADYTQALDEEILKLKHIVWGMNKAKKALFEEAAE